jgi:predicted deacylase
MRVETIGTGSPEVAVVGGIHGDEPCGVHAVERLLSDPPAVEEPVKLVVANERAIEADQRYLDADLNRSFPGDPEADAHEAQLAAELAEELEGCLTLAHHSTQSYGEPFAVVDEPSGLMRTLVTQLPVESVVTTGRFIQGRLFSAVRSVEVECGYQGSDTAAHNAVAITEAFLQATGILAGESILSEQTAGEDTSTGPRAGDASGALPVYRLSESIAKDETTDYDLLARNFERVDAGSAYASVDGEPVVADEPFYPVLMSENGYENIFGYAAQRVDTIDG